MDYPQTIINYVRKIVPLTDEEGAEFADAFKLIKVKKRQFIIQPEFTAKSRYFVLKPLSDLEPHLVFPGSSKDVSAILADGGVFAKGKKL